LSPSKFFPGYSSDISVLYPSICIVSDTFQQGHHPQITPLKVRLESLNKTVSNISLYLKADCQSILPQIPTPLPSQQALHFSSPEAPVSSTFPLQWGSKPGSKAFDRSAEEQGHYVHRLGRHPCRLGHSMELHEADS